MNVFLVADSLPFVNFDGHPIENGPNQTRNNDLGPEDVTNLYVVDLSPFISDLQQDMEGNYLIPVFTDLKRHDMGDFGQRPPPLQKRHPHQTLVDQKTLGLFLRAAVSPPWPGDSHIRSHPGPQRRGPDATRPILGVVRIMTGLP